MFYTSTTLNLIQSPTSQDNLETWKRENGHLIGLYCYPLDKSLSGRSGVYMDWLMVIL